MKEFLSEYSVFITSASLLIALVSLVLLYLNFRYIRNRPSKLLYQPNKSIDIFKSLSIGFKGFDIKYNSKPISNNVVFISGDIICKGKDIDSTGNEITVKTRDDCHWIDITIENKANINAVASISPNDPSCAIISFGKLRKDKSFTLNALLQTSSITKSSVEDIHGSIEFEHTIDNTDDVKISDNNDEIIIALKILIFAFSIGIIGATIFSIILLYADYSIERMSFLVIIIAVFLSLVVIAKPLFKKIILLNKRKGW